MTFEISIQTDDIKPDSTESKERNSRRNSSGSSIIENLVEKELNLKNLNKFVISDEKLHNLEKINNQYLDEKKRQNFRGKNESLDLKNLRKGQLAQIVKNEEYGVSPVNMKSMYGNEPTADSLELSTQSPGRLPKIVKKQTQPSSLVQLPQPIPALGDIKRYLKQANSRKKNES